ncbi:MAG: hypothetical protein AAF414_13540 [Pseudomonadota bacterium]
MTILGYAWIAALCGHTDGNLAAVVEAAGVATDERLERIAVEGGLTATSLASGHLIGQGFDAFRSQITGRFSMPALGCLAPFLLAIVGALIGHFIGGTSGLPWGLAAGLVAGGALGGISWYVMKRASDDD